MIVYNNERGIIAFKGMAALQVALQMVHNLKKMLSFVEAVGPPANNELQHAARDL